MGIFGNTKRSSWISNLVFLVVLGLFFFTDLQKEVSALFIKLRMGTPHVESVEARATLQPSELNWPITALNGEETNFAALSGKPVFLNFWATWCPPCRAEMGNIQRLYETVGDEVAFVLVTSEGSAKVQEFLDDKGYTFPVYTTQYAPPAALNAQSLPTTYILSADNEVLLSEVGAADWDDPEVVALLRSLLPTNG